MDVGLSPGDFVLDGDPVPSPERGEIFGPSLLWPNGWMDQDGTWDGGRPWSSPHCVRWGHSSPTPKGVGGSAVYCGQTSGWMKTPIGTEVDLGPDHFELDGFPAIRERGTAASAHIYCGHSRPSQLLLSSCY